MQKPSQQIAPALPIWHRGENCNFIPTLEQLHNEGGLEQFILHGWLPEKPFITKNTRITAFGSCFASYLAEHLTKNGYKTSRDGNSDTYVIRFASEIVNTFAIAQQFEWAWNDKEFSEKLWYTREKDLLSYEEEVKEYTKQQFNETDVFIITLGLCEIWYNKHTGEVFWRTPLKDNFNPDNHAFRLVTYQENVDNLKIVTNLIKKYRPNATVVFTVSPVPLFATFRPVSCITANSVSKSLLRAAADEVVTYYGKDKGVYYWPAYEIVKEYLKDPFAGEPVHVSGETVDFIMSQFSKYYLVP